MGRSSSFFHLFFRASRPESRASLATMLNVEFTDISTVEGEVPHVTPNPILLARSPLPLPLPAPIPNPRCTHTPIPPTHL